VTPLPEGAVPALIVEIDGHAFGIVDPQARPLETVPAVTPVPLAPRALAGLAQVEGEVLPVLWPGEGIRVAAFAVLTETTLGRVILLCSKILPDAAAARATVLPLDTLVESIRQAARA
jgi:chemotaxis signal transduction protein